MDVCNLLSYQFRNERGFVKTANLEDVYNKFKGKSDINAIYVRALVQWFKTFLKKTHEIVKNKGYNWAFVKNFYMFYNNVSWLLQYVKGDINFGSDAKEDIKKIIHEYHVAFDTPDFKLIDSDKIPMPVIQKEINLLYQGYVERVPYLTHKKGYRGWIRDYHYYLKY